MLNICVKRHNYKYKSQFFFSYSASKTNRNMHTQITIFIKQTHR